MAIGDLFPEWFNDAACVGIFEPADLFFPAAGGRDGAGKAIAICNTCPVKQPCLQYALDNHIMLGVWGGTTREMRRAMKWKLP